MQVIADLRACGVTVLQHPATKASPWSMALSHPDWGEADIVLPSESTLPSQSVLAQSISLTPSERQQAQQRRSLVILSMRTRNESILVATKRWLRWGRATAGSIGLCVIDHRSEHIWSIPALDAELLHDAPLDVSSLYSVRVLYDEESSPQWLHTHGLADLGGFDLDVFYPSPDMLGTIGHDILRAFAFRVLDGHYSIDTKRLSLVDGETAQLVPWKTFTPRAPEAIQKLVAGVDHGGHRAVLVDRQSMAERYRKEHFQPYRTTSAPLRNIVIEFSDDATALMAERAVATWPRLVRTIRAYRTAPAPIADKIEPKCFIKVGIKTGPRFRTNTEHLWFRVNDLSDSTIHATLESEPCDISTLQPGEQYEFEPSQITGWVIHTRMGAILPYDDRVARMLAEYGATAMAPIEPEWDGTPDPSTDT